MNSPLLTSIDKGKITILFMAADPSNATRLRLGEELREIQEKLQLSQQRDRFTLQQRMSVRPVDISQALLDLHPQIVHFSGHGTSAGELCFENKVGLTHPIRPDALASLFEQFSDQVKCVVLNACHSEIQASAIAEHIDYVVGMNKAIDDHAAIAFAIGFYQAIGAGRTIESAYKLGCVQIRLQGIPEHLTPVLIPRKGGSPQNSSIQPTSNTHLPSVIAPPLRIRAEGFPEQVYIQNESTSYIREESGRGYYSIQGEIFNNLPEAIYRPDVEVTFYDEDNNIVPVTIGSGQQFSHLMVLNPATFGPFHYYVYGPCRDMDRINRYEITATYHLNYNGWVELPVERHFNSETIEYVVVKNSYDYDIQGIRIFIIVYDKEGKVSESREDYVGNPVYVGGVWTFHINIPKNAYHLRAEGRSKK